MQCTHQMYNELYLIICSLLLKRTDLKTMTCLDVLHDLIVDNKRHTLKEYVEMAKKIINGETTYEKRKFLTIEQLKERRIFEYNWLKNAIENFPGYREKCKKRNIEWWRFQMENKTQQWVQINLNKKLDRLEYKIKQKSNEPIFCKIHNGICTRLPQRHNNHQEKSCQKTELYTLKNEVCFPKGHKDIPK